MAGSEAVREAGAVGTGVRRHITLQVVSVLAGFGAPADAYSQIRQIVLGTDRHGRRVEPALCYWPEMLRSWFKPVRAVDTSQ